MTRSGETSGLRWRAEVNVETLTQDHRQTSLSQNLGIGEVYWAQELVIFLSYEGIIRTTTKISVK